MKKTYYYILFDSHTHVMELSKGLRAAGIKAVISPTPRAASVCCGTSLMIEEENIDAVKAYINENHSTYKSIHIVEQNFNNKRDVYC